MHLKLLALMIILSIANSSATQVNITNDVSIDELDCLGLSYTNTLLYFGDTWCGSSKAYTYMNLNTNVTSAITLYLPVGAGTSNPMTIQVYKSESYNETTINWGNKPTSTELINSFSVTYPTWNTLNFTPNTQYLRIASTTANGNIYSSESSFKPYYCVGLCSSVISISGQVTFTDTDNTTNILPNAIVKLNNTINTTTDINGSYAFTDISNGIYNMTVSKNNAFNVVSRIITYTTPTTENFNLLFSKPSLSTPYVEGSLIKSKYSHNFKTLQLWENPYFVWGLYNYNGTIQKQVCIYQLNSTFACDLRPGRYKFNMTYSDIYNYDLSTWHPTLTDNRTFYTRDINIENGQMINDILNNKLPKETREKSLSSNVLSYLFIMFLIVGSIYALSFNRKRRQLKVYER